MHAIKVNYAHLLHQKNLNYAFRKRISCSTVEYYCRCLCHNIFNTIEIWEDIKDNNIRIIPFTGIVCTQIHRQFLILQNSHAMN